MLNILLEKISARMISKLQTNEASLLLDSLVSLSSLVSAAHLALFLYLLFLNP